MVSNPFEVREPLTNQPGARHLTLGVPLLQMISVGGEIGARRVKVVVEIQIEVVSLQVHDEKH